MLYRHYNSGLIEEFTDVKGNIWKYHYDNEVRIDKTTDPENRSTSITYTGSGEASRVKDILDLDKKGKQYGYQNDTQSKAQIVTMTYLNHAIEGKVIDYYFDENATLFKTDINQNTVWQLEQDGNKHTEIDRNGVETITEYDEWFNLINTHYPDGSFVENAFKPNSAQMLSEMNESGAKTLFEYDSTGNLETRIDAASSALENQTHFEYDDYGNRTIVRHKSDSDTDIVTQLFYDDRGNLIKRINPELGTVVYNRHDVMGNVMEKTDARGKKWLYQYNAAGQLKNKTDPLDNITSYEYDKSGKLIEIINPYDIATVYQYNHSGQIQSKTEGVNKKHPDQSEPYQQQYTYDEEGNLLEQQDDVGWRVTTSYDKMGRKKIVELDNNSDATTKITYEYNDNGALGNGNLFQPTKVTYPNQAIKLFQYDSRNRISQQTDIVNKKNQVTHYEYQYNEDLRWAAL
ncbi:MAG: RHS repeat protein [Alphaproteobacteria bacterium]|nr:RHS repeat protein [Alphaproteobacteria bacterium]